MPSQLGPRTVPCEQGVGRFEGDVWSQQEEAQRD